MVLLLGGLLAVIFLRKEAPPETARLLPESDAIVYLNLKPIRAATRLDQVPVKRSAEFERFVQATGIVPERDLDEAAFALHRMADPTGPNGPVAYSEIVLGHFDGERLDTYLRSIAGSTEQYAGHTVYTIAVGDPTVKGGGRLLRVARLGYDMIAASNMPTAEQIHSMLDRYRAAAAPFSGSTLLTARYKDVPLLSAAWGIGRIGLPFSDRGYISVLGLRLPLPEDTTFVASVRYTGALHLRVEEISPSKADAARSAEMLTGIFGLVKSVEAAQPRDPTDAEMKQALESLHVEQHGDRAVITASAPVDLLRKLVQPVGSGSR